MSAHLVQAAGCRALVIWGDAVSGFPGKFSKLQKQNSFSVTLSTVSSVASHQMEGMGMAVRWEEGEADIAFGVGLQGHSPLRPLSERTNDCTQERMALKTLFLYM